MGLVLDENVIGFPHKPGHGGPGSFQTRFEKSLKQEGYKVVYAGEPVQPDVIFVIGGTKRLLWLFIMKLKGVPIVHRLDGLAWLHKKQGLNSFVYGEWGNLLFKSIHAFLADYVVYQSEFVKQWWQKSGWRKPKASSVIYNGVDLDEFKPISNPEKPISLLCVEGTLDYSPYAIDLLNSLQEELIEKSDYHSLILYGGFQDENNRSKLNEKIDYRGKVSRKDLPSIYKDAVYLSLDVNAACPNTVVEALACGLPVVGYDTGALKELVQNAGKVADFGGNPWNLDKPRVESLSNSALKCLNNWNVLSKKAISLSQESFNVENISNLYISVIESTLKKK